MTATACTSCPDNSTLAPLRNAAIAIFLVACIIIWFVLSWKPMLSAENQNQIEETKEKVIGYKEKIEKLINKLQSLQDKAKKFQEKLKQLLGEDIRSQLESLTTDRLTQYLKLYISFFQVFSSFLTFHVTWPAILSSTMTWIKGTLFLDALQLPGLGCLWVGVNFKQRLFTYTLGPLVVLFLWRPSGIEIWDGNA